MTHHAAQAKKDHWFRGIAWIVGAALTTLYYFFGLHFKWYSADVDRGLLQGLDMARGNVLLNHWYSGSDSYWTIDSVFFAFGVLFIGAKVALLHLESALVWASVIMAGIAIATTDLRRWSTSVAAASIVVILGLPCSLLAGFLVPSTLHVATALYALLAFLGLRRGRFGWGWFLAVAMFAAGILGDPLIVAYGLIPAFIVGILDSVRARRWKQGISTWSAPFAGLAIAWVLRVVADQLGTYRITGTTSVVPHQLILPNLRLLFENTISLFGLGNSLTTSHIPWELELFRSFGLLAVVAGVVVGMACLVLGLISGKPRLEVQGMRARSEASFRLSDLLVLGFCGDAVTYVFLSVDKAGLRYLSAGAIFASILGAMLLGHVANAITTRRARRVVVGLGLVVAGVCASSVGVVLSQPTLVAPYAQLGDFLSSHHLYRGVGDYWSSAPTTVLSDEMVKVRQVVVSSSGGIEPYQWISKSSWYSGQFQFLVYDATLSTGQNIRQASKFPFAPVAHTYVDHQFHIVVWKKPETMLRLNDLARATKYPHN